MSTASAHRVRLDTLTGLRWAAAMLVFGEHILEHYFIGHFAMPHAVEAASWQLLQYSGTWGVAFFFTLSGFVLTWSARPTDTRRAFLQRRAAKIYPNHLVTAALAFALAWYLGQRTSVGAVLANLTLTQVWTPSVAVRSAGNVVSWSIACEIFFYLCFPFILPTLAKLSVRNLRILVVVLPVGVLGLNAAFIGSTVDHDLVDWIVYFLPVVRIAEFIVGMALAILVKRGAWRGPGLRTSLLIALVAVAVSVKTPYPLVQGPIMLLPVIFIVPAAALADIANKRTIWSRRPMTYLGEVSFAFYMIHLVVIHAARAAGLLPDQVTLARAVIGSSALLVVSFVAAVLLYEGVEKPFSRWLRPRQRAGRHRQMAYQPIPTPTAPAAADPVPAPAPAPVPVVVVAVGAAGHPDA